MTSDKLVWFIVYHLFDINLTPFTRAGKAPASCG